MKNGSPHQNIKWVAYDLHLILEYKGDEVTIFESAKNSMALQELEKSNYFHIGAPFIRWVYKSRKITATVG